MTPVDRAARRIRAAVTNPGPKPLWHQKIMRRHRKEWPTLWKAIDTLMAATDPETEETE